MSQYERQDEDSDLFLLGEQLRELREAQGLSHDDVAKSTHVRPHILKAIEEGRLDGISAPVYVRGFVKTYCEFLMANDLWKKYSLSLSSFVPAPKSPGDALGPAAIAQPRPVFRRTSIIWVYIILVIAVLGATFLLWNQHRNPESAGDGFFLRFTSPQTEEPAAPVETTAVSLDLPPESETPEVPAVIVSEDPLLASPISMEQIPVPVVSQEGVISAGPRIGSPQTDISWLDGNISEDATAGVENIAVLQSSIPDQRLLIETTRPVRLIVQQDGSVVTRRNLGAGGVRSYDVTISTPISLSVGNAAVVTWYGKKYAPVGSDDKPLGLVFYPDGSVRVTEGKTHYFNDAPAAGQ